MPTLIKRFFLTLSLSSLLMATAHAQAPLVIAQDEAHGIALNWLRPDPALRRLAYVQWDTQASRYFLTVAPISSSRDLATVQLGSPQKNITSPRWSADGSKLAYIEADDENQLSDHKRVWVYNFQTQELVMLGETARRYVNVSFSLDGSTLYAVAYMADTLDLTEHQTQVYGFKLAQPSSEFLVFQETGYVPQVWDLGKKHALFYLLFHSPNWPYGTGWIFDHKTQSVRALPIKLEPSDYTGSQLLLTGLQSFQDPLTQRLWLGTGKQVFDFNYATEVWNRCVSAGQFQPLPAKDSLLLSDGQDLFVKRGIQPAEKVPAAPKGVLIWYRQGSLGLLVQTAGLPELRSYPKQIVLGKNLSKRVLILYVALMVFLATALLWRLKAYRVHKEKMAAGDERAAGASPLERLVTTDLRSPAAPVAPAATGQIKSSLSNRIKGLRDK